MSAAQVIVSALQLPPGNCMAVEAHESVSDEAWTRWQGHVVNRVFPLGRYLGSSDHSGVFLTKSVAQHPSEVAIKLVPANRALAESLLPRWKRAAGLTQPHLLRLLEWGGCQLEGLPYLYLVMEYADQTLAQLLQHRALTDDEAREMLPPILDALAFLHGRNLLQGQLKPANILVVGDQLKLASDTIRQLNEREPNHNTLSVDDPPESLHGSSSTRDDIWALGASLFEALTRRAVSAPDGAVTLPADFSPAFRDVVTRCLSRRPQDRPRLEELAAWAQGRTPESAPAATIELEELASPEPRMLEPQTLEARTLEHGTSQPAPPPTDVPQAAPVAARAVPPTAHSPRPRASHALLIGAVAILALGWIGMRVLGPHRSPAGPRSPVQAPGAPASSAVAPAVAQVRGPVSGVSTAKPAASGAAASPSAVHEVIPEVPRSALRTVRGHIQVWVRVIVDQDGSVFGAETDRAGPSRYFMRLAVEAAKKWTFPRVDAPARRLIQLRFDFSRDGTKVRAVTLP